MISGERSGLRHAGRAQGGPDRGLDGPDRAWHRLRALRELRRDGAGRWPLASRSLPLRIRAERRAGRHGDPRLSRAKPDELLPMIASDARLIVWPGTGSRDGEHELRAHAARRGEHPPQPPVSEDTIFVLSGKGTIADLTNDRVLEFEAGQVLHVPPGVQHQVRGDRGEEIVSVGGPSPADGRCSALPASFRRITVARQAHGRPCTAHRRALRAGPQPRRAAAEIRRSFDRGSRQIVCCPR